MNAPNEITPEALLVLITTFYINSHDFNGIPLSVLHERVGIDKGDLLKAITVHVRDGRIDLMFASHCVNPHIKRIAPLPIEGQLKRLIEENMYTICAYPNADEIRAATDIAQYADRPYIQRLMLAEPQLQPVFFDLSILERYFQDPRYSVEFDDRSGSISVKSEYTESGGLRPRDDVFLETFGIGYSPDRSRVVVAYLRYLSKLSPEHQRIWQAHEIAEPCTINSDYERASILGDWPQYYSAYQAFIHEQLEINTLAVLIGRPPLFKATYANDRPPGFQPMLRPTSQNFDEFVKLLDKMLSDNIEKGFFGTDIPLIDELKAGDGSTERRPLNSLTLLERWLQKLYRTKDGEDVSKEVVGPLKKIRQLRSKPSHAIGENKYDPALANEQDSLLSEAIQALSKLRLILMSHPKAKGHYTPLEWLDGDKIVFF